MGVVGDVRRDMEGHHYAEACSVFGISEAELAALHRYESLSYSFTRVSYLALHS